MDVSDQVAMVECRAEARREGERKAGQGGQIEDNPYDDGDLEDAWRQGFLTRSEELQRAASH